MDCVIQKELKSINGSQELSFLSGPFVNGGTFFFQKKIVLPRTKKRRREKEKTIYDDYIGLNREECVRLIHALIATIGPLKMTDVNLNLDLTEKSMMMEGTWKLN